MFNMLGIIFYEQRSMATRFRLIKVPIRYTCDSVSKLMPEVSESGKYHSQTMFIGRCYHLFVTH